MSFLCRPPPGWPKHWLCRNSTEPLRVTEETNQPPHDDVEPRQRRAHDRGRRSVGEAEHTQVNRGAATSTSVAVCFLKKLKSFEILHGMPTCPLYDMASIDPSCISFPRPPPRHLAPPGTSWRRSSTARTSPRWRRGRPSPSTTRARPTACTRRGGPLCEKDTPRNGSQFEVAENHIFDETSKL